MTLREIGELMGLKESFISRVRKGERSFTLQRLQKLEASLGKPLTVILIEATPIESAPAKLKPLYAAFRGFLASLDHNGQGAMRNWRDASSGSRHCEWRGLYSSTLQPIYASTLVRIHTPMPLHQFTAPNKRRAATVCGFGSGLSPPACGLRRWVTGDGVVPVMSCVAGLVRTISWPVGARL